jgi:crossover junction endodeoxyribonuclease RusA
MQRLSPRVVQWHPWPAAHLEGLQKDRDVCFKRHYQKVISMQVTLPWFPKELRRNNNVHWGTKAKYTRIYRTECWAQTRQALGLVNLKGDFKVTLRLTFYPPSRRQYDLDNCVASMKAGLDGVADALQVNDHRFHLEPFMSDEIGGFIKIDIRIGP